MTIRDALLIILAGGLLGGIANYLGDEHFVPGTDAANRTRRLVKSLVLGLVASLLVPLFLELAASDLLKSESPTLQMKLVLFGFCVAAGVFSRTFIDNVGGRVLNAARAAEQKANEAVEKVKQLDPVVDTLVRSASDPPEPGQGLRAAVEGVESRILSVPERVLHELGRGDRPFRSSWALAQDTGVSEVEIRDHLEQLHEAGRVGRRTLIGTGETVWFLIGSSG